MWKIFKRKARYYLQFFPFTLNTFLVATVMWLTWRFVLKTPATAENIPNEVSGNSFLPFILLLTKLAFYLFAGLIILSMLSAIVAWAYYLWLKNRKGTGLQLQFTTEENNGRRNKVFLNAALEGAFRPLLGFVKGRLFYDDFQLTDRFALLGNKRKTNKSQNAAISGKSRLQLPDIKEYEIRGGLVFFEDMLHLFSLAVPENIGGQFYQLPTSRGIEERDLSPRKTENTDIRIDEMRRVEGDPLHYKTFEPGDDIRRIVWKVYAKNKDLVVRVPERFEPYASHLYFYASFYTAFNKNWVDSEYGREMLNYFKNNVWTVFDTLSKKEFEIRYISDQQINMPEGLPEKVRVGRTISSSDWHHDKNLGSYFNARQGTVLCISSFTDTRELSQILDQTEAGTVIYFIRLSNTFRQFPGLNWLKRLIFLPPEDRLGRLKDRWLFSTMRLPLIRKEKEIASLLDKSKARILEL